MRATAIAAMGAALLAVCLTAPAAAAPATGSDYVFVIDGTGTMRYQGRADATLDALRSFIDAAAPGDRIAVYAYGEEPVPALARYPMVVSDAASRAAIKNALEITFNADRTDITRGLEIAWSERDRVISSSGGREAHVVLLTDGKLIPMYDDYSQYDSIYRASRARLLELGTLFGKEGVRVHTIGLGATGKIDGDLMSALAERGGGRYYAARTGTELASVFDALSDAIVTQSVEVSQPADETRPVDESPEGVETEVVSAEPGRDEPGTVPPLEQAAPRSRRGSSWTREKGFGLTAYQVTIGLLGVLIGVSAIGIQQRKAWTNALTRPIAGEATRVKGYMKPVAEPGAVSSRSYVPLENFGLPAVEVGTGHEYLSDLKSTVVRFVGTSDGTPPKLEVLMGSVTVDGQVTDTEAQLKDGDVILFETQTYMYLRGRRK